MEINTHGRSINKETLANASNSIKGLGSRMGEYVEIFYDKVAGVFPFFTIFTLKGY